MFVWDCLIFRYASIVTIVDSRASSPPSATKKTKEKSGYGVEYGRVGCHGYHHRPIDSKRVREKNVS